MTTTPGLITNPRGAFGLPVTEEIRSVGTTAQRPIASAFINGAVYLNETDDVLQVCNGTSWVDGPDVP